MNNVLTKEEIVSAILKLDNWKDIEYIIDKIYNFRNPVFDKWSKDNRDKISE